MGPGRRGQGWARGDERGYLGWMSGMSGAGSGSGGGTGAGRIDGRLDRGRGGGDLGRMGCRYREDQGWIEGNMAGLGFERGNRAGSGHEEAGMGGSEPEQAPGISAGTRRL